MKVLLQVVLPENEWREMVLVKVVLPENESQEIVLTTKWDIACSREQG